MDSNEIGNRIGNVIAEQGYTQQQVADGIGVKRETVVQWLNGSRKIKAEHILMLSRFLNVSSDYLLGLSAVKSVDTDLKSVCDYTGLSEEAIETLHKSTIQNTISAIIVSGRMPELHASFINAENALHCLIDTVKSQSSGNLKNEYKQYPFFSAI